MGKCRAGTQHGVICENVVGDPRLGEVVEEIELRAAVELAKLGR